MNVGLDFTTINWLAVITATVSAFLLGGLWYSPAMCGRFLPQLMAGVESRTGAAPNIVAIFVTAFLLLWTSAAFLAGLLGPVATAREGMEVGLAIGLFFVFPPLAIAAIFGSKPVRLVFITGGYFIVCFGIMGLILGALR